MMASPSYWIVHSLIHLLSHLAAESRLDATLPVPAVAPLSCDCCCNMSAMLENTCFCITHLRLLQVHPTVARLPQDLYSTPIRRTALCDYLTRTFGAAVSAAGAGDSSTSVNSISDVLWRQRHSTARQAVRKCVTKWVFSGLCTDIRTQSGGWHGSKGGEMTVDMPGQHVIQRTSCSINEQASLLL